MDKSNDLIKRIRTLDPKATFSLNQEKSAINILKGNLTVPVDVTELRNAPYQHARQFIKENKSILSGIDETKELINVRTITNRRGITDVEFQQKYGDALVVGGTLSVHYGADGGMYLVKSDLAQEIDVPKEPKIPADDAVEIAKKHAGEGASLYENMKPILEVVDAKTLNLDDKPQRYYLCWKIGIILPPGSQQTDSYYIVDALNGEIRLVYPAVKTGTGTGFYSHGTALNSEKFGSTYRLRDIVISSHWPVATKPVIHTYDDNGSTSKTLTNYSEDSNDNWNNGGATPSKRADDQRQEVDLHRFMGYVLSYYYQTHEHNGWDGKGSDSKCHAHNESRSNDAYWSDLRQQIYFSSGNGTTHDFICTLAYVGHEFTHGVNYGYNRVQNYNGETGALNEAIADIFGALISLQHRADAPEPYIFGSQCSLSSHGYRNMSDPSRDTAGVVRYDATNDTTKYNSTLRGFCPDHYDIRYTGSDDYNGVHINCTIITHAVYLMMNGGTHRFSNVTVTGIGVEAVQEMLYRVVSTYLRETSNFEDFRTAFILACEELYPEYLITIKMAFHAVGIGPNPLVELAYFILE